LVQRYRKKIQKKLGEFNEPRGITLNKDLLYVCDYYNHRIQTFWKVNYIFHNTWGLLGEQNGQFNYPYAICFSEDIVYVGDGCSVQLFTFDGEFIQRIGGKRGGKEEGQFTNALGICIVKNRLYVSDTNNKRIQIFS